MRITPTIYSINIQGNEATVDFNVMDLGILSKRHQELRQDITFILIKKWGRMVFVLLTNSIFKKK